MDNEKTIWNTCPFCGDHPVELQMCITGVRCSKCVDENKHHFKVVTVPASCQNCEKLQKKFEEALELIQDLSSTAETHAMQSYSKTSWNNVKRVKDFLRSLEGEK